LGGLNRFDGQDSVAHLAGGVRVARAAVERAFGLVVFLVVDELGDLRRLAMDAHYPPRRFRFARRGYRRGA
jgi:hypothetical protein